MKSEIKIEDRLFNGKMRPCYIPYINDVPILGEFGFILKESINDSNEKFDNLSMAQAILNSKVEEITSFMSKNSKFFKKDL